MAKVDPNSALEREMDEVRNRLAGTIDELVHRTSPKTIASRQVASVKAAYVDPSNGQPKTANILKAAGVVAGVAVGIVVLRAIFKK